MTTAGSGSRRQTSSSRAASSHRAALLHLVKLGIHAADILAARGLADAHLALLPVQIQDLDDLVALVCDGLIGNFVAARQGVRGHKVKTHRFHGLLQGFKVLPGVGDLHVLSQDGGGVRGAAGLAGAGLAAAPAGGDGQGQGGAHGQGNTSLHHSRHVKFSFLHLLYQFPGLGFWVLASLSWPVCPIYSRAGGNVAPPVENFLTFCFFFSTPCGKLFRV